MSDKAIQIRDLILLLQQVPDHSDYIQAMTDADDLENDEGLTILELKKDNWPRTWNIMVTAPEPDEDALDEAKEKGFEDCRVKIGVFLRTLPTHVQIEEFVRDLEP